MHCLTSLKIVAELWCQLGTFSAFCICWTDLGCPTLFYQLWRKLHSFWTLMASSTTRFRGYILGWKYILRLDQSWVVGVLWHIKIYSSHKFFRAFQVRQTFILLVWKGSKIILTRPFALINLKLQELVLHFSDQKNLVFK